jgi:drug/metabolite transporter (DMT)-like permease
MKSRGLIGSTSVILRYYALQYLTIGDTAVITYSTPVLVTVMAHFFLDEKCGVIPVIIAFTTLGGVIIVTRPPLLTGGEAFDNDTLVSLTKQIIFNISITTVRNFWMSVL